MEQRGFQAEGRPSWETDESTPHVFVFHGLNDHCNKLYYTVRPHSCMRAVRTMLGLPSPRRAGCPFSKPADQVTCRAVMLRCLHRDSQPPASTCTWRTCRHVAHTQIVCMACMTGEAASHACTQAHGYSEGFAPRYIRYESVSSIKKAFRLAISTALTLGLLFPS